MKIWFIIVFGFCFFTFFAQNAKKIESYSKKNPYFKKEEDSIAIKKMNEIGIFDFEIRKNEKKLKIVFPVRNFKEKIEVWIANKKKFDKKLKSIYIYVPKAKKQVEMDINWITILRDNVKNKTITIIDKYSKEYIQFSIEGMTKYKNLYIYRYVSDEKDDSEWVLYFRNSMDRVILRKN